MSRAAATVIALLAVAASVVDAGATATPAPTISCNDIIGHARTSRDAGYRLVLGVVSVPPARLTQVEATHSTPWTFWRKAGLVIRAGNVPVSVSIPRAWRRRAAITWGSSGTVSALTIAPCPTPPKLWNAYAGGFYLRLRHECVPLTFTVGRRTQTVRFGLGGTCPNG